MHAFILEATLGEPLMLYALPGIKISLLFLLQLHIRDNLRTYQSTCIWLEWIIPVNNYLAEFAQSLLSFLIHNVTSFK